MKAYIVRLISDRPSVISQIGLIVVENGVKDLYWALGEFAESKEFEFSEARGGDGILCPVEFDGDYITVSNAPGDHGTLTENVEEADRKWYRFIGDEDNISSELVEE